MKHVGIEDLIVACTGMSKKEKLARWAELVKGCDHPLALFHNLEYCTPNQLKNMRVVGSKSAFETVVWDPVFAAEGLPSNANITDIMRFFDLTQNQLHEFSCDCGGWLSNEQQARRIASLI